MCFDLIICFIVYFNTFHLLRMRTEETKDVLGRPFVGMRLPWVLLGDVK